MKNHLEKNAFLKILRNGNIKNAPCVICGAKKTLRHHEDYNKPLEIICLCPSHHSKLHAIKKKHPAKNIEQIMEMLKLYKRSNTSTIQCTITVPDDLKEKVKNDAKNLTRSFSEQIVHILKEYYSVLNRADIDLDELPNATGNE